MAKQLMKGCEVVAEAAVRAGCRFYAGYPITPQTAIPEYLSWRLPEVGGRFIQGESEVASINMLYGAGATGTLAMTSSTGLGMSLKAEGISYIAGARFPAVIVNVVRGGSGIGTIQPAQQDYLQATKAMGHGGHRMIVLAPHTVQEIADMTYRAFELTWRDRNPVVLLIDGSLGQVMEEVELPPMKELPAKPDWTIGNFGETQREPRLLTSGTGTGGIYGLEKRHIMKKEMYERWAREETDAEEYKLDDAEYVLFAYGMPARICKYAIEELRREGVRVGLLRPKLLYPFPKPNLQRLDYSRIKAIIDVEEAIPAQMYDDIALEVRERVPILTYTRSGGVVFQNEDSTNELRKIIGGLK